MPGKIGIKIPSHNSLTPAFFDELLRMAATSRKNVDAHKIRRRLPEKCHIAIISTGLSYLAYLGALKKTGKSYRPNRWGKKIGKFLAQDRLEEANLAWNELLKRHKLWRVFVKFLSSDGDKYRTIEDFGLYLKRRAHAKWNISATKSRLSRLCELFADKGLIDYQSGKLSLLDVEEKEIETLDEMSVRSKPNIALPIHTTEIGLPGDVTPQPSPTTKMPVSITANSWPIKIEIKLEISDKASKEVIAMIFSHIKDLERTLHIPLVTSDSKGVDTHNALTIRKSQGKREG